MSIGGSGVGGNIGGPQIPLQRDLEATAWTEVNKQALGIVREGDVIPFQQIIERYQPGYLGGFGYKATSENPLLDHPLETQRRAESSTQQDSSWQNTYENFINQLPPELLARFDAESKKPFEQRNLSFVALDNNLQLAARILTQLESSAKPAPAKSLEETRTNLNLILPFAALKGALQNGQETVQSAKQMLIEQGANYRYFDSFNNVLTQLASPLNLLSKVYANLDGGQLSQQAINAASKAAQQLATIGSQLERTNLGTDLQLLLPTIKSLEMVSSALSLQNTPTATLFIALYTATIGLFSTKSPLGILGQGFETLTANLNQGLIAGIMPPNNNAGNQLLSNLVISSFTVISGLTSLGVQSGLGLYPLRDPKDVENARGFALEIAAQLAASSGILNTFYKEAIAVSGGNSQAQELGSTSLASLALLLVTLSATKESNKATRIIEDLFTSFTKGLAAADEIERKDDEKQTNLKEDNDKRTALAIAIKLGNIALESKNYDAFLEATNNLFESLGTSQTTVKNDLNTLGTTTSTITGFTSRGDPNQQMTGIINII